MQAPASSSPLLAFVAVCAVAVPLLLALAAVPDAVFYNQLAALAGWGLWLLLVPPALPAGAAARAPVLLASMALALLALLAAGSHGLGQGGATLVLCAALPVLWAGVRCGPGEGRCFAMALWLAGVGSVAIALVQYFAPSLADGAVVALNSALGRAVGNMRQPNHLATALLCAMVMTAWLWQAGQLAARTAVTSIVLMVLAVALSASRTGALSLGVLLLWAAVDRSLPRAARWALALTPLIYLLCWASLAAYAALDAAQFYGAQRLEANGDISSSRFAIWRNALALLAQQPWTGVGWGNFNFAWTFTPFPDRPAAFFDHTHNLPLQLAVETGLPATAAVLGLLTWALWRAHRAWCVAAEQPGRPVRAAFVMLAVLAMHSLLEYPLWYAYFLLPAAWALGVFLGAAPGPAKPGGARAPPWTWRLVGVLLVAGSSYAAWDHRRIQVIFAPAVADGPLAERIAEGRKSVLFGHHADYAAVTSESTEPALTTFSRPLHQLIDVRLLVAYTLALKANGRDAEALYAAQRLREFRRADAQEFFKDCGRDNPAPPFQCNEQPVRLNWRDLEP